MLEFPILKQEIYWLLANGPSSVRRRSESTMDSSVFPVIRPACFSSLRDFPGLNGLAVDASHADSLNQGVEVVSALLVNQSAIGTLTSV